MSDVLGVIIRCDHTRELLYKTDEALLSVLQRAVGGYIERIKLSRSKTKDYFPEEGYNLLIVNEEGIPLELPVNEIITEILGYEVRGSVVAMLSRKFK